MKPERFMLDGDWYDGGMPGNIRLGRDVYLDTSYCFGMFASELPEALVSGSATGFYDRSVIVTGPRGRVRIGDFGCVNGTTIIAHDLVAIGHHALLAWGAVITDGSDASSSLREERRAALTRVAHNRDLGLPHVGRPQPVVLEDNVWIGFDAVVGPGVTIGRGAVVGARSVVTTDVAPYTVVVGDPARVVAHLPADDGPEVRAELIRGLLRELPQEVRGGTLGAGSWLTGNIRSRIDDESRGGQTT